MRALGLVFLLLPALAAGPRVEARILSLLGAGGGIQAVAYGAGVFVAAAPFRLLVSRDGERWQVVDAPARMNAVVHTEVGFLAVGNAGVLMALRDGYRWKRYSVGREWDLFSVAYGNGLYVVVANAGELLISRDLKVWRRVPLEDKVRPEVRDLAYGRGRFVAGMSVFRVAVLQVR